MLELKKGEKVILKGFTGIKLGVFEVASTTKKTISVMKQNGDELIFDRKTGKQVNVEEGKERYANSIMEDDGSYVAPSTKGAAKKKAAKKNPKGKAKEPEEDLEDEDADEEPVKKTGSKKKTAAAKKSPKKVVVEDDEDEDEDEADTEDDDEYEEVDD